MIPIKKEPKEMFLNTRVYEVCVFCREETMYWHVKTNTPVCQDCAKEHNVSELLNSSTKDERSVANVA
jgi:hypothetical protein